MRKAVLGFLVFGMVIGLGTRRVEAADKNAVIFVSVVRGREFWRAGRDLEYLKRQKELLENRGIPNTWLVQYDALLDQQIVDEITRDVGAEKGMFLEVTPKLSLAAFVNYDWMSEKWERADKVFVSGYEVLERKRLIETAFEKFKERFGYFPKSVGAWYVDGASIEFMKEKYGIEAVLGVSDQYSTDGYQVWGQPVGVSYIPSRSSVIEPAAGDGDKLDVVKLQWAAREPLLAYGPSVEYSNYSVQVNDYFRFHGLGEKYIEGLMKTYTLGVDAKLSGLVLGLEVGELEDKYWVGLSDQLRLVERLGVDFLTMGEFGKEFKRVYGGANPFTVIKSQSADRGIEWYQTGWYRAGVTTVGGRRKLVDLRFYHSSSFCANDWVQADKRQNLYRVVPAVIDDVGLGNGVYFDNTGVEFGEDRIFVRGGIPLMELEKWPVTVTGDDEVTVIRSSSYPSGCRLGIYGFGDRIRRLLGRGVPDIRLSKLDGDWVVGLRIGPELLLGVDLGKRKVGTLSYPYPILESFLNLDKWRKPEGTGFFGREEDMVKRYAGQGEVVVKGAQYGTTDALSELGKRKSFEDSYYFVVSEPIE